MGSQVGELGQPGQPGQSEQPGQSKQPGQAGHPGRPGAWGIRRATLADLAAIMQIETSTFENDAWSREGMRSELQNPQGRYFVAFDTQSDNLVGYAGVFCPTRSAQADIQTIAVVERARRTGLGRALMQTLIAEARDRGAVEVFLEVRADNPGAQKLYASLGFEQIAVRVAYYQPDGMDAWVMRAPIDPIVEDGVVTN